MTASWYLIYQAGARNLPERTLHKSKESATRRVEALALGGAHYVWVSELLDVFTVPTEAHA